MKVHIPKNLLLVYNDNYIQQLITFIIQFKGLHLYSFHKRKFTQKLYIHSEPPATDLCNSKLLTTKNVDELKKIFD